jgi:hypothetical protein
MGRSIKDIKQMIEEALDESDDIEDYEEENGNYKFSLGSTKVYIEVYKHRDFDLNLVCFRAGLAYDFDLKDFSRKEALQLLAFNWEIPMGNVSLNAEDAVAWFEYNIPADFLRDKASIATPIGIVGGIADGI